MNAVKIIRIVATVLAIVAAFVTVENLVTYVPLALALLGLANGFMGVSEERRLIYLVTAGVLSVSTDALDMVPAVGGYITAIAGNISIVLSAGVIAVVAMIIKDRLSE